MTIKISRAQKGALNDGGGEVVDFWDSKEHSFSLHSFYQAKQANMGSHSGKGQRKIYLFWYFFMPCPVNGLGGVLGFIVHRFILSFFEKML